MAPGFESRMNLGERIQRSRRGAAMMKGWVVLVAGWVLVACAACDGPSAYGTRASAELSSSSGGSASDVIVHGDATSFEF
jgi:hypothetical protein